MLSIAALWHDSPRWIRGWFIGNLVYVSLALLVQLIHFFYPNPSEQLHWLLFFIAPVFLVAANASQVVAHAFWCVLGALCVSRWGEKVGVAILLMTVAILELGFIGWFIYALSHMTIF